MTIDFDAPMDPLQEMANIVIGFVYAKDPDQPVSGYFTYSLYGLIGLTVSRQAGRTAPTESVSRFRKAVANALVEQVGAFRAFVGMTYDSALNAANGDWYRASLGRSVLQILLDDFKGTGAENLVEIDEVEEIDDILQAAAPEAAPLSGVQIPAGLPEHHWWWRLPSGSPDDDEI